MRSPRPRAPRLALLLLLLVVATGVVVPFAVGADPDTGTVSLDSPQVSWTGKDFTPSVAPTRTMCSIPTDPICDRFELTVDIDAAHWDTSTGGAEVVIAWGDANDDFDLYVLDNTGAVVGSSARGGTTSERVIIEDANRDAGPYEVVVTPFQTDGGSYDGGVLVIDRADVPAGEVPTEPVSNLRCENGLAGGIFPCKDVDLEGFIPVAGLNDGESTDVTGAPVELNDIWGWTDPETGREYAIVGKTIGTAFVDITDPRAPRYLGSLVSSQKIPLAEEPIPVQAVWRDIKVYENHAFIVSEEPTHGMQVFDLTRLRGVTEPQEWTEDTLYTRLPNPVTPPNPDAMGNSHNIAINEDSGFAYVIGTDTCEGGPHMIDIREPKAPEFAGCVAEDGYTHDTQCVIYDGPDERYTGREICFNSNEDTLTIVDVTDKDDPVQLSRQGYEQASYTHQGWLTRDGRHFLVNDELDEQDHDVPTTTRIFDVTKLDNPTLKGAYVAKVGSIDHNLYAKGDDIFEANYRSGLRILDASKVAEGQLSEKAFFDVYPPDDEAEFNGAWSNYPYYDSGVVVVSGIEQGLFVLRPRGAAPAEQPAAPPVTPAPPPPAQTAAVPQAEVCATTAAFRSARARARGRRVALSFTRRTDHPVQVDVFQTAVGRRVVGERLVARFTGKQASFTWNGKANRRGRKVRDGYYFVRFRTQSADGTRDIRRTVLRRKRGRFSVRRPFHARESCSVVRTFKLGRPVFGGRRGTALKAAYRLSRAATVRVEVLRGKRVVKRFAARSRRADTTYRVKLASAGLPRGDHRVRLTVRRAGVTVRRTLVARRL